MKKNWFTPSLLTLWFLVCSGLTLECDWDQSVNENQSLDPVALNVLTVQTVSMDPESCRNACCVHPNCDMALVSFPMDAGPQCQLVSCWLQGQDQCVLQPRSDSQFKVYRKKVDPETRSKQSKSVEQPRIVPLMGDWEPKDSKTTDTNQTNHIICRQPVKTGSCRAAFPKFFYNVTDQSCSSFIYGGCEGNGNNFDSQDECEHTCSGVTGPLLNDSTPAPGEPPAKAPRMAPAFDPGHSEDVESPKPAATESVPIQTSGISAEEFAEHCSVKPDVGPCRAAHPRWFYNHMTGNCEKFTYGGCRGNKNNYISKESCSATCTVSVLPSFTKPSPDDVFAHFKEHCHVKPDAGHCRAAFPRWFYNHMTGNCEMFTYGGCGGNKNNYDSKDSCTAACTASYDSHGEDHNEKTAAFFLFLTLAVISALLLVALIIVSLRHRHRSRRLSSVSDKQELLPEDEHSSLESLSIPGSPKPDRA